MRLINLKKVWDHKVIKWIEDSIPELTPYQKQRIRSDEIVRFAPFYFMEENKKVKNVALRFSIIAMPIVLLLLITGLPFNFFVTGNWGYGKKIQWYGKWVSSCGI